VSAGKGPQGADSSGTTAKIPARAEAAQPSPAEREARRRAKREAALKVLAELSAENGLASGRK
jgi:hypothetical protein